MHLLRVAAHGAFVQIRHILERLACHLSVSLLHMRGLLLGHSLENAFPDITQQTRYALDGSGDRNR